MENRLTSLADFATPRSLLGMRPNTLLSSVAQPTTSLARLVLSYTPPVPALQLPIQWYYVRRRFSQFLSNISLTDVQFADGKTKQAGIRDCLNRNYYGYPSETANSMLIGSWGKQTRVRPARDIDILFILPAEVYWQYDKRVGNKQSQLLQEVKSVLDMKYTRTDINGDRHVVVIPFATTPVEVAVGFQCTDGSILVCDTKGGGSYTTSTAEAELNELVASDAAYSGNTRALIRIMKQWQSEKNVPLKSFQIERVAIEFMAAWENRFKDIYWADWMIRDFFAYLYHRANGYISMPGTGELVALGDGWQNRTLTAYNHAVRACEFERDNRNVQAGTEWQSIFGSAIPLEVS